MRGDRKILPLARSGIASPAAPSPARHGGCKKHASAAPLALCYENRKSSALPPCFSGEINANDGTLFSARVGWAEGPSRTPATKRARDLIKEQSDRCRRLPDHYAVMRNVEA